MDRGLQRALEKAQVGPYFRELMAKHYHPNLPVSSLEEGKVLHFHWSFVATVLTQVHELDAEEVTSDGAGGFVHQSGQKIGAMALAHRSDVLTRGANSTQLATQVSLTRAVVDWCCCGAVTVCCVLALYIKRSNTTTTANHNTAHRHLL